MKKSSMYCTSVLILVLAVVASTPQAQTKSSSGGRDEAKGDTISLNTLLAQSRSLGRRFSLMPMPSTPKSAGSAHSVAPMAVGPNLQVLGGGTLGRLTKWTGFTSSNSFIGDTTIFEDKSGNVGIGTDTPASKLYVLGTITAIGLNASSGGGTAVLAQGGSSVAFGGTGIKTMGGSGTNNPGGAGLDATGGTSTNADGGDGVFAAGGLSTNRNPGRGLVAFGGRTGNDNRSGGAGVFTFGGDNTSAGTGGAGGNGGSGVISFGAVGSGAGHSGGIGIEAFNGNGISGATPGLAGKFNGDVQVTGNLSKGGGSFKIDHPLDPENKYLYHSFVESPDMKNIYDGNVTTDGNGLAIITLPDWFEALNRDFRYQLTVIGTFAQAIVSQKIRGNRFQIKTNAPNVEVSWQVTGIRQDGYANKHRIPVEEEKSEDERGYYLHPEVFNQPEERGMEWARYPQIMQQLKQKRVEAEKTKEPKTDNR